MDLQMPTPKKKRKLQWRWFFVTLILGMGCIFYAFLQYTNLHNSAALYIGLPLLLALGLSLTPETTSALGMTLKGITIALLLSVIIFREGYICILFTAPIFYFVGALIAIPIDYFIRRRNKKATFHSSGIVIFILMLFSLEGVTDWTAFPRHNEITASKIVNANMTNIQTQLAKTPKLAQHKPLFLKIFPYPAKVSGEGLNIGDKRTIKFIAYKQIWWNKVEGDLVLKVVQNKESNIKFDVVEDTSYLSHYLRWRSSEVFLDPVDENYTRVTWRLSYDRILDPAWYFGPMQHYAVKLAAQELIDHAATP